MLRALGVLLLVAGPASATALRPSFDMRGDLTLRVFPSASLPTPLVQMIPDNYTPASDPPTLANTGSAGGTWTRHAVHGGGTPPASSVDATALILDANAVFNQIYYDGMSLPVIAAGTPFTLAIRMGVTATIGNVYDVVSEITNNDSTGRVSAFGGAPSVVRAIGIGDRVTVVLQYDGANQVIDVDGLQNTVAGAPTTPISGDLGRTALNTPRARLVLYRYEVWDSVIPIANVKAVYDAI